MGRSEHGQPAPDAAFRFALANGYDPAALAAAMAVGDVRRNQLRFDLGPQASAVGGALAQGCSPGPSVRCGGWGGW